MTFKLILMVIICVFFILGAIDYFFYNRFGIGEEFAKSFPYMGRVILGIAGMVCLSPIIARELAPIVTPILTAIGADPAMFAATLLSPDAGGYNITVEMAQNEKIGLWAGTVVSAHIGSVISFNIPTCISIIDRKNHRSFSLGALSGLSACPFGCILGGLIYGLPISVILINMIPALILSGIVIFGLLLITEKFLRVFVKFTRVLTAVILFGLIVAAIERLTGFVLIEGMNPISQGFLIGGTVGLTMGGILPLTKIITKVFKKPLDKFGRAVGMNPISIIMIFNTLSAVVPGASAFDEMDSRGKVIFAATVTSIANILGAHLGFIGIYAPELLMPMFVSKVFSGILGITIAVLFYRSRGTQEMENTQKTETLV